MPNFVGLSLPGRRRHGLSYGDIAVIRLSHDYCRWTFLHFAVIDCRLLLDSLPCLSFT